MTDITLRRRTESLRQEAAEAWLWLLENAYHIAYDLDEERICIFMDKDTDHWFDWKVAEWDERTRCEAMIAIKDQVWK